MVRITLGIVAGAIAAALILAGGGYAAHTLHPFPAGADPRSLKAITDYIQSAPPEALACIVAGCGLAALVGGWFAAFIARPHRGGAALAIGTTITVAVIVVAALVPQPNWMPVLSMLLPIPLTLCGWRLAIPRAEL